MFADKYPSIFSCQMEAIVSICPEMQVNEMHALYDKHHKVSSFL